MDCIVAAKTSPPTGAALLAFSTALVAVLAKVLYAFEDRGHFLLHFADQVIDAARIIHQLVDARLGQFGVQLGDFVRVFRGEQLLGAGNRVVEKLAGGSHVQGGQALDAVEGGTQQGHHDFGVRLLGGGQLIHIRVAHHLLQSLCGYG
jgi:hypothetical protein